MGATTRNPSFYILVESGTPPCQRTPALWGWGVGRSRCGFGSYVAVFEAGAPGAWGPRRAARVGAVFGRIHQFLSHDHERLDAALKRALAAPDAIDMAAYGEFRAGLLRHIAMEEKVLFVDAKARRGGEPLALTKQLHVDHAALASMLVPPPTHELMAMVRAVLDEHNPLEEDPGGLYELCEELAGPAEIDGLFARMQAIAPVRAAQHLDEPRIHGHIERMLAARRAPKP